MDNTTKVNHGGTGTATKSHISSSSSSIVNLSTGQYPIKRDYFPVNERTDAISLWTALILCADEISETVHGLETTATLLRTDVDINMQMLQERLKRYT